MVDVLCSRWYVVVVVVFVVMELMLHNVWTDPAAGGLTPSLPPTLHCAVSSLPVWLQLVMSAERRRTQSESEQDLSMLGRCQVVSLKKGVDYDVDGKFSYSQV